MSRALEHIRDPRVESFDGVAAEVLAFQIERYPAFRRFCEGRGLRVDQLASWREVPPVPTAAFRVPEIWETPDVEAAPARIFRTSGTSAGSEARGVHPLPELALYDAAWEEPFRRHLMPDRDSMCILSLVPHESVLPESSLSYMATRIVERFGTDSSAFLMGSDGLELEGLVLCLSRAVDRGEAVLCLTTGLGALAALEGLAARGESFRLAAGSRVMDTGGMKGRRRDVRREELLRLYEATLGLPAWGVVGEYGMTELCSQFYETSLGDHLEGRSARDPRPFEAPPWVRTQVLDPRTLEPLPPGKVGLLSHVDLANAWTLSAVLTEDLGTEIEGGFALLGRAKGAELRGCSLATEEILDG